MGLRAFLSSVFKARSAAAAHEAVWRETGSGVVPRPFNYDAAMRQFSHWAYAAAMLNANAVANVPLRLYARTRPGQKLYTTRKLHPGERRALLCDSSRSVRTKVAQYAGDYQEVVEPHPALTVLQRVNPTDNGYALTVLRMIDLQITGNSYWLPVEGAAGVPVEVWRLLPQYVEIIPSKSSLISGYRYGLRPNQVDYAEPEVDHFKLPNPKDQHYGMGWYQAAWSSICLHDSKRTMDLSKFDNFARPDYLLSLKDKTTVNKEVIEKFREEVQKKLRGPRNAGNFLAIGADVGLTPLNFDVPEVGTATRVIEEISAVSGVPVAMLLTNDPARANSQAARVGWYRNTIRPYCRLDEEKLNERWLPRFDGAEDLVLCYDLVSFEDEEMQAKRLSGLVAGGILKPNEARAEMGYDPLESTEADRLYPPAGNTGPAAALTGDLNADQNNARNN